MHWADRIAESLIKREDKDTYVCAAGISPSGSVHIGNFRDIVTSYFVCLALRKRGKQAQLLFSWDEFDRLRKIPANVAEIASDFSQYLGMPYADAPDPFGCCASYAKHFENEFEAALSHFGIQVDFRYQASEYRSGRYVPHILTALHKRHTIFDILDKFRTQESTPEERENYYPVSIYCPICSKDDTKITNYNQQNESASYHCACGHSGEFHFETDFHCKLSWKTDWPMRWMAEKVDFEPGGKDHASPAGSYQTSKIISETVFGYRPPMFQGYEFIGIKGATGKMSGSTGLNLTPAALFKLYQPEIILWLYAKTDPMKAFNFCFDDEILRQYFEFDKSLDAVERGAANELTQEVISYSRINGRKIKLVPMQQLVSFGSIVDFVPEMLETIFAKIGTPFSADDFLERINLAKYWLFQCSPENIFRLRSSRNIDYFAALSPEEQSEIRSLYQYLTAEPFTMNELQAYLYAVPSLIRSKKLEATALKTCQATFFRNVYQLLLGAEKGPRLYLFLFALDKNQYIDLLRFEG